MKNKTKELYIKVLEKTKENIKTFYQQYNNEQEFTLKNFHCDFEEGLYRCCIKCIFPHITIKFCYWHFQQLMEKKRKTFLEEYTENQEVRELFKTVITLPFIDTNYIKVLLFCKKANFLETLIYIKTRNVHI